MKKYVLLGVIALVMLLAVPVAMAANTAPIDISGSLDSSLSISIDNGVTTAAFGTLVNGDNYKMAAGTLRVSALRTPWQVTTTTATNPNGYMLYGSINLATQLQQQAPDASWPVVIAWTVSHPQEGTLNTYPYVLDYYQKVVDGDVAGSYSTTVTYTVAAT